MKKILFVLIPVVAIAIGACSPRKGDNAGKNFRNGQSSMVPSDTPGQSNGTLTPERSEDFGTDPKYRFDKNEARATSTDTREVPPGWPGLSKPVPLPKAKASGGSDQF